MSVRSKGQQVKHHHHHHHLSSWAFLSWLPVPLLFSFPLTSSLELFKILISSSFFFFSRTFYPHLHPADLHHHVFCISQNNSLFQEVRRVFIPSRSALFRTFSHFLLSLFTSYLFSSCLSLLIMPATHRGSGR